MPLLETAGGRLHYLLKHPRRARAPLMVLLHAVGLQAVWWTAYLQHYRPGWRVAAVDLPGHGLSSPLRPGAALANIADEVAQLIDQLRGPAHVVGVSMGGMVAQELALRHAPLVSSLVLLSTLSGASDAMRTAMRARGALGLESGMDVAALDTAQRWAPDGVETAAYRERCFQQVRRNDARNWATCWEAISQVDSTARLPSIACPVLVAVGERDASTTPEHARAIASAVRDGRVAVLPGGGHMLAFSRPAACQAVMDRFYGHVASVT